MLHIQSLPNLNLRESHFNFTIYTPLNKQENTMGKRQLSLESRGDSLKLTFIYF